MKAQITLVRAVGSEFVTRKLQPIVLVFAALSVVLLVLITWLVTISAWWWLLAVPIIIFIVLGLVVYLAIRVAVQKLRPQLTGQQTTAVKNFVDKLERVADNLGTPMPWLVFRVVRDVMRPREKTFIHEIANDSTTLRTDFIELQRNFK